MANTQNGVIGIPDAKDKKAFQILPLVRYDIGHIQRPWYCSRLRMRVRQRSYSLNCSGVTSNQVRVCLS